LGLRTWSAVLALGLLAGCGATIGDACTTDQDCGGRSCRSDKSFPGGYCTQSCVVGDSSTCPSGAKCVQHHDSALCLRQCAENSECRTGYTCHDFKGQGNYCLSPDDG
jgi:hypothetical protein